MKQYCHWIDGKFVAPSSGQWIDSLDPYLGETWARIAAGNSEDADLAVAAAKRAMTKGRWATMTASERGAILGRIAEALQEHNERLAEIEVRDNGKLMVEMRGQLNYAAGSWRYFGGLADKIEGSVMPVEKPDTLAFTLREPVGVVLAITAWNSPLTFLALKCAPALAAGCAVVLKPSEFSSISSIEFAAIAKEAGLPDGVLNVVTGYGRDVGAYLVEHPDISQITFTGSDVTGARIYEAGARHMKRVAMELGGKSPNIIFADADLDAAVQGAVSGIFGAAGQMCTAGSRLLVQNSVKDEVTERVLTASRSIRMGNPMDPETNMGPLSNTPQYQKTVDYIEIARREGATCIAGGKPASGPGITGGHFIEPTIFTDVRNDMRIAQEEVFGPILSIIGFEDEDEAIRIGNDIAYGLAAGVWTRDIGRLFRVSKGIRAGLVWGNTYRTYSYMMPVGGMKSSGVGRENGIEAINEFLETKSIMISISDKPAGNSFVPR